MQTKKYREVNGTFYHKETKKEVIDILESCLRNDTRIVVDYGDTQTGKSWNEEYDIKGYIGRSTGQIKIPLLVYNKRSRGGGGLLDHCIIKISTTNGGAVLYKHPKAQ